MTDLRHADPAPTVIDPHSLAADAMLADVLSTARVEPVRRRRGVIGLAAATVAAAAVVAVPAFWPGDDAPSSAHAFEVTRNNDGSVTVRVDPADFEDPAALQKALREAGLRAYVSSKRFAADAQRVTLDGDIPQGCEQYPKTPTTTDEMQRTQQQLFGDSGPISLGSSLGEMTLRPDRLPKDGAYLLTAAFVGGELRGLGPNVVTCA